MPGQRLPGAAPVGRRIRIRSRIRLPPPPRPEPTKPVQHAAATVGAVFGLIGLLGFIPGLTMHIEDLSVAGHPTRTLLFGLFAVSVLHNVIHLVFAVGGLALATSGKAARWYLLAGGGTNVLLAGAGWTAAADWVPINPADMWLHLIAGGAMLLLSLVPTRATRRR